MKGLLPGGEVKAKNCTTITNISTISSTGCFRVQGLIEEEPVSFLLDTGAPVTLLRKDVWDSIQTKLHKDLKPWTKQKLVGVNGTPIQVHGQAVVNVKLGEGEKVLPLMSSLTIAAIIGRFPEENGSKHQREKEATYSVKQLN